MVVPENTLYPTLYKLMGNKMISDREVPVGKRRVRVYYHFEEEGKQRLQDLLEDYNQITVGISQILSCTQLPEENDESND